MPPWSLFVVVVITSALGAWSLDTLVPNYDINNFRDGYYTVRYYNYTVGNMTGADTIDTSSVCQCRHSCGPSCRTVAAEVLSVGGGLVRCHRFSRGIFATSGRPMPNAHLFYKSILPSYFPASDGLYYHVDIMPLVYYTQPLEERRKLCQKYPGQRLAQALNIQQLYVLYQILKDPTLPAAVLALDMVAGATGTVTWGDGAPVPGELLLPHSNYNILRGEATSHNLTSDESPDHNPYSEEPLLPSPTPRGTPAAPNPRTVVLIDAEKQKEILKPFWKSAAPDCRPPPRCLAEEWLLFSLEERRALHQYALDHTLPPPTPPELQLQQPEPSGDDLSDVELMKRQRDMKRRRQAYRTTATGAKSLTEVTREMIDNIMEIIGVKPDTTSSLKPDYSKEESKSAKHCNNRVLSDRYHKLDSQRNDPDCKKKGLEHINETEYLHLPGKVSSSSRSSQSPCRRDWNKHHPRSSPDHQRHRSSRKSNVKSSHRDRSDDSRKHKRKRDSSDNGNTK